MSIEHPDPYETPDIAPTVPEEEEKRKKVPLPVIEGDLAIIHEEEKEEKKRRQEIDRIKHPLQ